MLNILEKNIQDSVKLSTLMNHVSCQLDIIVLAADVMLFFLPDFRFELSSKFCPFVFFVTNCF